MTWLWPPSLLSDAGPAAVEASFDAMAAGGAEAAQIGAAEVESVVEIAQVIARSEQALLVMEAATQAEIEARLC